MIGLISVAVAALLGFLLRNVGSPIIIAAIAFFGTMFVLNFFYTVAKGENLAFKAGCQIVVNCCSSAWGCLWLLQFMPLQLFIYVGIVGGILTSPIWAIKMQAEKKSYRISSVIGGVFSLIAAIVGAYLLFTQPEAIYRIVPYGWVIAIFACGAACMVAVAIALWTATRNGIYSLLLIAAVAILPAGLIGVFSSNDRTYHLKEAADMALIANAPSDESTLFVLDNDIDFTGKKAGWFGEKKRFKSTLDGQGFTLYNLSVDADCMGVAGELSDGLGLVRINNGVIKNLNMENLVLIAREGEVVGAFAALNEGTIEGCTLENVHLTLTHEEETTTYATSYITGVDYGETYRNHLIGVTGFHQTKDEEEGLLYSEWTLLPR